MFLSAGLAPGVDTSKRCRPQFTAPGPHAQCAASPRFVVLTTKTSGAQIVFGIYQTGTVAAAVAARLIQVGGKAHVVEVRP